jgi:hypothetical protein
LSPFALPTPTAQRCTSNSTRRVVSAWAWEHAHRITENSPQHLSWDSGCCQCPASFIQKYHGNPCLVSGRACASTRGTKQGSPLSNLDLVHQGPSPSVSFTSRHHVHHQQLNFCSCIVLSATLSAASSLGLPVLRDIITTHSTLLGHSTEYTRAGPFMSTAEGRSVSEIPHTRLTTRTTRHCDDNVTHNTSLAANKAQRRGAGKGAIIWSVGTC